MIWELSIPKCNNLEVQGTQWEADYLLVIDIVLLSLAQGQMFRTSRRIEVSSKYVLVYLDEHYNILMIFRMKKEFIMNYGYFSCFG